MKVLITLAMVALLMLTGCASTSSSTGLIYSPTPQAALDGLVAALNAGRMQEAARYLHNGPEQWQSDPQLVVSLLNRWTHDGPITRTEITENQVHGDLASISGTLIHQGGQVSMMAIQLVHRDAGWIIVSLL